LRLLDFDSANATAKRIIDTGVANTVIPWILDVERRSGGLR
jgi:hypothetical protein